MKNLFNSISQEEKNRILEMHSGKKNVISEQYFETEVKQIFDSCRNAGQSPMNVTALVDNIHKSVQGLGTDEDSIFESLTLTKDFNTFCKAVKNYKTTYGNDLYSDLDGDIDEDWVWERIYRILRLVKGYEQE